MMTRRFCGNLAFSIGDLGKACSISAQFPGKDVIVRSVCRQTRQPVEVIERDGTVLGSRLIRPQPCVFTWDTNCELFAEELLGLPMLAPDQVTDPLHAYQLAKRGNSLRVMAEAVRWGKRGARLNTIGPGIIFTPLAKDELTGPRGEGYRRMIELSPVGRGGTPDEVWAVGALLMGPDGTFITGSDFLMDGGVTASYFYGELAPR